MNPSSDTLLEQSAFVHRLAAALLRDAHLAEDVAQEALLAGLQDTARPASPRGWLAVATRRLGGKALRSAAARRRHENRLARPEAGCDEARTAARLQLHRRLCDAVLALPEPYRTVVTLRHLEGLSPRAIGRRLGRDAAVVRQQIHRGLAQLRQRLDGEFGGRDAWLAAFGACGLGVGGAMTTAFLLLMAMKKVLAAAVLTAAVGSWWLLRGGGGAAPPPAANDVAASGPVALAPGVPRPEGAGALPAPAAAEQRTELGFTVLVADADGQPLRGATVRLWREQGEAEVRESDADGRVTFAPGSGSGVIRAEAAARAPVLQQVPRVLGELRVVLGQGAVVAGRMLVDGASARPGLRVQLVTADKRLPENLPAKAAAWLQSNAWLPACETRTGADGAFAFAGLAADWRGALQPPQPYWIVHSGQALDADNPRQLSLASPQRDVVLATTQLETVTGRVVWADTGEPVAGPLIDAHGVFADGDNTPTMGHTGDREGRFAIGFAPSSPSRHMRWLDPARRSPLARVRLDVLVHGSGARTRIELDAEALARREDLVVRVPRATVRHFAVVDDHGAAIAGARVQVRSDAISEPTDGDGRGTFAGEKGALVGARGFLVVPAVPQKPAAGTREDPLVFVLARGNELAIRLRSADGGVPAARRVELRGAVQQFAGDRSQGELDRVLGSGHADCGRTGKNQPDGSILWTEATAGVRVGDDGAATLYSLAAGVPCTVAVLDGLDTVLAAKDVVLPAAGEKLVVELVVAVQPRRVHGRVLDQGGAPLAGAPVRLEAGEKSRQVAADSDGAFAFADVYTDQPVRLVASQTGHAAQERTGLARAQDGTPVELRLPKGRSVHVTVRDDREQIVPVSVRVERGAAGRHHPQTLAPGDYVFKDLPPGTVAFVAELGGARFELEHDTGMADAVLRVPSPARVVVAPPADWPAPEKGWQLGALATRLDVPGEPFAVRLQGEKVEAALAVPGRYRFELVAERWSEGRRERRVLGPAAEVAVAAGETTRIVLR